jgi:hypothetical protein
MTIDDVTVTGDQVRQVRGIRTNPNPPNFRGQASLFISGR